MGGGARSGPWFLRLEGLCGLPLDHALCFPWGRNPWEASGLAQ